MKFEGIEDELKNILHYWITHSIDERGGFHGRIDNNNVVDIYADKGSVLNCRILWTFSAAYFVFKKEQYLRMADRAVNYISENFIDKDHGGVYWSVNYLGKPADTNKRIYGQAFAVYAFSEHYRATGNENSKRTALTIYELMLKHSHDKQNGGYIEAFSGNWAETHELRLSSKDANERKSMNTNLHVLEAFANLYRIWPDELLKNHIEELLDIFLTKIQDPDTGHLHLFFDDNWKIRSNAISCGHDIEAAWLLQDAAETIHNSQLVQKIKAASEKMTLAAMGGIHDEGDWWPRAEAVIGFYNNYLNTGKELYLQQSLNSWNFIRKYIIDHQNGEWFWGVDNNNVPLRNEDKVGFWKCPYHNSRCCFKMAGYLT